MTENPDRPLSGRRIVLAESRELDALAGMLEAKGAIALRYPLVAILDAPDAGPIEAWLHALVDDEFDDLILMTGEGLRRLLDFARRADLEAPVIGALGRVRKLTRGPKPAKALRELGLAPDLAAEAPTTPGVIATLAKLDLRGRVVAVQNYGQEPNLPLTDFLTAAGATVRPVAPYIYAPASDEAKVLELLAQLQQQRVDVIAFTSAAQVQRLWDVASRHQRQEQLRQDLAPVLVAAVGPVVAGQLQAFGIRVDVTPERSFFLRPLVNAIVEKWARRA